MRYRRFEELPVWNGAIALASEIYRFTSSSEFRGPSGFRDQIERAAVSISNNIAEGFERGTNGELLTFLYIARGSAGEVRSMLWLLKRMHEVAGFQPSEADVRSFATSVQDLLGLAEGISRQLGAWIESIKNSSYDGERSRNDAVRSAEEASRRRAAFQARLDDIVEKSRTPAAGDGPPSVRLES